VIEEIDGPESAADWFEHEQHALFAMIGEAAKAGYVHHARLLPRLAGPGRGIPARPGGRAAAGGSIPRHATGYAAPTLPGLTIGERRLRQRPGRYPRSAGRGLVPVRPETRTRRSVSFQPPACRRLRLA
jgi:hypothetical protein